MGKRFLITTVAAALALIAIPLSGAWAGDDDAGYNSSDTDSVTIGSDPNTGGPTEGDADQMQQIQQGIDDLKSGAGSDDSDDSGAADDASGH